MTEIKINDEDVEIAAEAGFSAKYRWRPESWNVLSEPDKDSYRSVARAVLEALVASGWRREAEVLRKAAEEIERDGGSVLTALWAADALREKASEAGKDQERDEELEHG